MAKFTTKDDDLFIDGKKVIKAWESFTGWFWFATKKVCLQDSILPDKDNEGFYRVAKDDQIWYGFVQGLEEEWGNFSQAEIESLGLKAWRIPKKNLHFSGRRS